MSGLRGNVVHWREADTGAADGAGVAQREDGAGGRTHTDGVRNRAMGDDRPRGIRYNLRAALRDDPLVMPDRIIAAYRLRGGAP